MKLIRLSLARSIDANSGKCLGSNETLYKIGSIFFNGVHRRYSSFLVSNEKFVHRKSASRLAKLSDATKPNITFLSEKRESCMEYFVRFSPVLSRNGAVASAVENGSGR